MRKRLTMRLAGRLVALAPALLGAIGTAPLAAQPLEVFSEFAVIDAANGRVTAPELPREILSPALARNAFNSFQIVIRAGETTSWRLFIAQNPENAVRATLYLRDGDTLMPVAQPVTGAGTKVLWMDLWVDAEAPVARIKVEPQLRINEDWVIYPMEARIVAARVPDGSLADGTAPPGEVMRGFLCGAKVEAPPPPTAPSVARMMFRNAQQDRALAPAADRAALQERFGACDAVPPADNPEWYLRVRDLLYRSR